MNTSLERTFVAKMLSRTVLGSRSRPEASGIS